MTIAFRSATEAGTGAAGTTQVINVPSGVVDGDLLLLVCGTADGDTGSVSPNGTWTEIVDNLNTGGAAPSPPGISVFWRIASSEPASYTITDTESSGIAGQMLCFTGVDNTTPIDVTTTTATGDGANADPPSIDYLDAGAAIVIGAIWDSTTSVYSAQPTGYTSPDALGNVIGTGGGNGLSLVTGYDLTPAADPENPGAFTSSAEQWAAFTIALRPAVLEGITSVDSTYGVGSDELDFDDADVDVNGLNFGASQGSGTVYISDASTLAGSANEVEIANAINTWADTLVNLDFSGLTQTEIDNLHTLGPGARFIIVTTNAADEYSIAVALHRPNAIEMVLSGNFAPGSTTQRLTGLTGTFAGGRIEEALNPSSTDTNVASNGNREDVWNVQLTPGAREVTYDFRVLYGDLVPDTITQTPQVTGSFGADHTALPTEETLALAGQAPTANVTHSAAPAAETLALAGQAPTVDAPIPVVVTVSYAFLRIRAIQGLYLNCLAPTIEVTVGGDVTREPAAETLSLTGEAPTLTQTAHHFASPAAETLSLTGQEPVADTTANWVVAPDAGALLLAGKQPVADTTANWVVEPAVETLAFTGYAPSLTAVLAFTPDAATLVLAGEAPSAEIDYDILIVDGSLVITGLTPELRFSFVYEPGATTLTLAGQAPSAERSYEIVVADAALAFSGKAPSVLSADAYAPAEATLALAGQALTILRTQSAAPDAGSLTLTSYQPTVGLANAATPSEATLVLAGQSPTLDETADHVAVPAAKALVLDGKVPFPDSPLSLLPGAASLNLITNTPRVINSEFDTTIPVGAESLVLTESTPSRGIGLLLRSYVPSLRFSAFKPDEATLSFGTYVPTTVNTSPVPTLIPTFVRTMELEGYTAAVEVTAFTEGASLQLGRYPPIVTSTSPIFYPPVGDLTFTGYALGEDLAAEPGATGLALSGAAPSTIVNHIAQPAADSLLVTGQAPLIIADTQLMRPAAGSLALTTTDATVGRSITPEAKARRLNGKVPAVVIGIERLVAPSAGALTLSLDAPVVNVGPAPLAPAGVLAYSGKLPALVRTLDHLAAPSTANLALQGFVAGAPVTLLVTPGAGALRFSRFAPVKRSRIITYAGARCRLISLTADYRVETLFR